VASRCAGSGPRSRPCARRPRPPIRPESGEGSGPEKAPGSAVAAGGLMLR
jgi:hypothetical protein